MKLKVAIRNAIKGVIFLSGAVGIVLITRLSATSSYPDESDFLLLFRSALMVVSVLLTFSI
ncbi:hypothetical protein [Roseobacter fucihabitans]|uniref:hypothetical protein n=1 Tax=Roseobacter fucihabitans TaxID=1537242 RepID=UPI0016532196|nr:hypothetical protein [Roseobacter litoralis]